MSNSSYSDVAKSITPITSSTIWSSVMNRWASSCVNARTRIRPCRTPCISLRWQSPASFMRSGRSRYDRRSLV